MTAYSAYVGKPENMEAVKLSSHSADRGGGWRFSGTTTSGASFSITQSTISQGGEVELNGELATRRSQ
ncbi:MAG: hypothetical protein KDD69_07175 [Bdellovibrionales bacterium]|nr:hypothetical protein [Bdellovibrionales bacterium]